MKEEQEMWDFLVYPKVQIPNRGMRSRTMLIKTVRFNLPPQGITDAYEQKRYGEIRKKQREVQSMLHYMGGNYQGDARPRRKMNPNSLKNLKNSGKHFK
jgi:hypothetical protein